MPKLNLRPESPGYARTVGSTVIATRLRGGLSRMRRDIIGASELVKCFWNLDRSEYDYFNMFYETDLEYGSLPFEADLIVNRFSVQTYTCQMVPDTFKLPSHSGLLYRVEAELEVLPITVDHAENRQKIDAFNANPDVDLVNFVVAAQPPGPTNNGLIPDQTPSQDSAISNLDVSPFFVGTALTFAAINLPTGLTMTPAGVISGTPTTVTNLFTTIVATDSNGNKTSQEFGWTIQPVTTTAPPA